MRAIVLMALLVPLVAACSPAPIGDYPDESTKRSKRRTTPADEESDDEEEAKSSFTLTVSLAGAGAGTITSIPEGLSCNGNTCVGTFPSGTKVTLKPTPEKGSYFVGWGGECSGDQPEACAPVMNGNVSVSAELDSIVGTWKGTYVNTRDAHGCTFNNAGELTVVVTANGETFSSTAQMGGLELRFVSSCKLSESVSGAAPATNLTIDANKLSGNWPVLVQRVNDTLDFPFTATVTGKTMTGTWNCSGCKDGGFTLTKQ